MSPVTRKAAPIPEGVNFGDLGFYSAGFLLPEGDYAIEHEVKVHAYTKGDGTRGQEMLGVMLTCHPLTGGEAHEQFLSMGKKAILSFAPDAETGKKLVGIPNAPTTSLAGQTNWNLYLKSLYDSGLPPGTFTNDLSVLDGIWVHTQNVPEPESRKSLGAATGEVGQQQRGPQFIPIVTEIKEDGKPWENSGGIPEAAEEAPAAPAPKAKAVAKPAVKMPAKKVAAPVVEESGDEELMAFAVEHATTLLEKNPNGMLKLGFRTGLFGAMKKADDAMAQSAIDTFFADDDALNSVIGQLGYVVAGGKIAVAG